MGSTLSAIRDRLGQDDNKKVVALEQLDFLAKGVENKLHIFKSDLDYRIDVKSAPSDALNEILGGIFDLGDPKNEEPLVTRFKKIVQRTVDALLGDTYAGEHSRDAFFVFVQHNVITRTDVKLWRYTFTSNGIMGEVENAVAWVCCTSVVSAVTLTADELIFFLSENCGDEEYASYLDKIWRDRSDNGTIGTPHPATIANRKKLNAPVSY